MRKRIHHYRVVLTRFYRQNRTTVKTRAIDIGIILAITGLCIALLFSLYYNKAVVICEGEEREVASFFLEPENIIHHAGYTFEQNDRYVVHDDRIVFFKAHTVTVKDENDDPVTMTIAGTVADALAKAEVKLGPSDTINIPADTVIDSDKKIYISRFMKVLLKVDGKKIFTDVTSGTVGGLLNARKIKLGKDDKINVKPSAKLYEGMKIEITRIKYDTVRECEYVAYKSETSYDGTISQGTTVIKRAGQRGEIYVTYKDKYVNGKLDTRTELARETHLAPVTELLVIGTKKEHIPFVNHSQSSTQPTNPVRNTSDVISELIPDTPIELDENGRPLKYKKLIVGQATAYANDPITAVGLPTKPGRIAVNPKQIPYGTKMYIVSCDGKWNYGYSVACDTGGFVHKTKAIADLFMWSEDVCNQFGRRDIEIYILE